MNWLNPLDKPRRSKADFPLTVTAEMEKDLSRRAGVAAGAGTSVSHGTLACVRHQIYLREGTHKKKPFMKLQ